MSDEFYDEFGEPVRDENIRSQMKALQAKARRADELEAKLADMGRDVAFSEAGIPKEGLGQLFRDAYKGDTSPEAIKAKAAAYGLPGFTQAPPAEPSVSDDELAELRRAQGVTASGGESIIDPMAAYNTALAAASNEKEVLDVIQRFAGVNGLVVNDGTQ